MSSNNASNRNDDGRRRSVRRSISPLPPRRLDDDSVIRPAPKKQRTSLRKFTADIKYCSDLIDVPSSFKCAGCSRWDETRSRKTKPRDQIKTREYQCLQIWTTPEANVAERHEKHYSSIMGYIETAYDIH